MRCEAGAYYVNSKLRYACSRKATFQLVVDGADLLLVWCSHHASELGPGFVSGHPRVWIEPIPKEAIDAWEEDEEHQETEGL